MPQTLNTGPEQAPEPGKKGRRVDVRIDPNLYDEAARKAESRGWSLSSVIRALLALWVQEDVLDPRDVGLQRKHASKPGSGRRPKKKPE